MKKLLIFLFLTCSLNVFSQVDAKSKTVLKDFILGYDSESSLIKKGIVIDELNTTYSVDNISIVRLLEYDYTKDIVLVFVDHTLYSVRYYPNTDRKFRKYVDYLNTKYDHTKNVNFDRMWFNKFIQIEYNLDVNDNWGESFVHYDIKLLEKYPQFKDF